MPIMIYAIFDKDKNYSKLEQEPELYKLGLKGKLFNSPTFWLWIVEATLQALVITIIAVYAICYTTGEQDGRIMGMWEVSDLIYFLVVIVCNLRIFTFSRTIYWFSILAVLVSIGNYLFIAFMLTEVFPIESFLDNYDGRGSTSKFLSILNSYAAIVLSVILIFLIPPMIKYTLKLKKELTPPPKYQEIPISDNNEIAESEEDLPLSTYTPLLYRKHTGFAFSGEPGHTPQITDPKFFTAK
jgi:magnesium-transporting ATPase (P-type)